MDHKSRSASREHAVDVRGGEEVSARVWKARRGRGRAEGRGRKRKRRRRSGAIGYGSKWSNPTDKGGNGTKQAEAPL